MFMALLSSSEGKADDFFLRFFSGARIPLSSSVPLGGLSQHRSHATRRTPRSSTGSVLMFTLREASALFDLRPLPFIF